MLRVAAPEKPRGSDERLHGGGGGGDGGSGGGGGDGGGGGEGEGERVAGGAIGPSQGERLAAVEARLEGIARLAQQVRYLIITPVAREAGAAGTLPSYHP